MGERRAFSVAVYARYRGKVLLIRHKRLGTWLPVGGEVEAGETPLEAAGRELREESGLSGRFETDPGITGTPPGWIGYEEHPAGAKGRHLNHVFVAEVDTDAVTPNDEFSEHRWVDGEGLGSIECPVNVRELGLIALAADSQGVPAPATVSLQALARRWLACFNARDLDGLLDLYAENAVHVSPKLRARDPAGGGRIAGKPALRAWWADSFRRLPGLRYEERALTASGDRVVMEYLRIAPGEEDLLVAETLVVEKGRIRESRVFHG